MKKRVIKIAALVVLFAAVLVISNVILNRGNDDQVVDMGDATLPRVSFMMGGQKINALSGYVDDMDRLISRLEVYNDRLAFSLRHIKELI